MDPETPLQSGSKDISRASEMRPPCRSRFKQTGLWDGLHPSLVQSSVSLAPKQIWAGAVYAEITSGESKRHLPLLPEELRRADVSGSVREAEGVSEDPCERLVRT